VEWPALAPRRMAGARTALLAATLATSLALGDVRPGPQTRLPQLLALRGGVQPALASGTVAEQKLPTRLPSNRRTTKLAKSKRNNGGFGIRDAVTTGLCLTAVGALVASAGGTNFDPLMVMVPREQHSAVWLLLGGLLSSGLFAIVRLVNNGRARQIGAAVGQTVFGIDPTSTGFARAFSAPAVLFAIGSIASFQTLPSSAG